MTFAWIALAVLAHEAGHALAAQALRLPWRPVLSWRGPGIRIGSDSPRLTRWQVGLTAAAGPLASILLAVAAWTAHPFVAVVSLDLALWNLVLPRSDGRLVLRALRG